jgi:serine/threonine-protein kinase HipA
MAGLGEASRLIAEVLRQTPEVIAQVSRQLPPGFPARVSDRIFAGMQEQAMRLGGEP